MICELYELDKKGRRQYCGAPAYRPEWDNEEHPERCKQHYPWEWVYVEGSFTENLDVPIDHPNRFMAKMRQIFR